ncbi:hypothetical protein F511_17163 [Dorcoceras hygrometricum]|uniref:Uncharacterized protein n=1 Tax=Dorcoceras hygrometricum TaxID=472368 RepID=A0A2Z7C2R4_9LAMI|nr:hypothetical protein F511_17163 [Dorcoceras hygrometricum]
MGKGQSPSTKSTIIQQTDTTCNISCRAMHDSRMQEQKATIKTGSQRGSRATQQLAPVERMKWPRGYNIQLGSTLQLAKLVLKQSQEQGTTLTVHGYAAGRNNEQRALYLFASPPPAISGHDTGRGTDGFGTGFPTVPLLTKAGRPISGNRENRVPTEQLRAPLLLQLRYTRTPDHASSQVAHSDKIAYTTACTYPDLTTTTEYAPLAAQDLSILHLHSSCQITHSDHLRALKLTPAWTNSTGRSH